MKNNKWDYNLIKQYIEKIGCVLIDKNCNGYKSKVTISDNSGYYYFISIDSLSQGRGLRKFYLSNPYTIQNIRLWLKINNKNFELISEVYSGNKKHLKFYCLKCFDYFDASWDSIYSNNTGCPYCVNQKVCKNNCLMTTHPELAKEWHPTKNGDLTPYDITYGCEQRFWWVCSKNSNHEWCVRSADHSRRGCPYCSGRLSSKNYNLLIYNPELCKEWDYNKNTKKPEEYVPYSNKKVWWVCRECGNNWIASITNRNKGRGCLKCAYSKGEKVIHNILIRNNIEYISQKEYDGLVGIGNRKLSYDFYLPDYNLLIEYQGEQHEKPIDFYGKGKKMAEKQFITQQEHDRRKRDYAKVNNINFFEIWYYDFDRIEKILMNYIERNDA